MLRHMLVSIFFVLFVSLTVKGDPVIPVATIVGGTITANSAFSRSIEGSLNVLDPNGNLVVVGFASQGGSLGFFGVPGTPVVFSAGIAGTADQGNVAMLVLFQGTGPAIPNVNTPTLDLIGFGTIELSGTVFANHNDLILGQNPLFTVSGIFSGPVALHFTLGDDGFYHLRSATAILNPVPEPISLLLLGSGLSLLTVTRRFFNNRRG